MPLFSICIPAYKRISYLKRALDSIAIQTFRDFEVIVTDDSPSDEVGEFCKQYMDSFPLKYFKNPVALGTPENWNEGIRQAKGQWIKLMHDDDWFAVPESLAGFANAIQQHPQQQFFFSAYINVFANNGKEEVVKVNSFRYKKLVEEPATLFSSNCIGPPSVILHRNNQRFWYDKTIKWVVDIDFYIRYLKGIKPIYINEPLIKVGINEEQVTQSSFRIAEVEIPEGLYLLNKVGVSKLKNVMVYDAIWRLLRNLNIKDLDAVRNTGYLGPIPEPVKSMIQQQQKLPNWMLKAGALSKICMLSSYLRNKPKS